ncbi:hypothetical protein Dimus_028095, partial [Dionaea muscipula]
MSIVAPKSCSSTAGSSRFLQSYHRRRLRRPSRFRGLQLHMRAPPFHDGTYNLRCTAGLITDPDAFQVRRFIGSYGFINITSSSHSLLQGGPAHSSEELMGRLMFQDVGEGTVKVRLYDGRIAQGSLRGTPVFFKVYPGRRAAGAEADIMSANELRTHALLQDIPSGVCQNLQILLGGFETKTGEQWLVFRDDGRYTAAEYAKYASEQMAENRALGEPRYWSLIRYRRHFVVKLLQGIMNGLVYMHDHGRLHQSLGPASVVINTMSERDADYLIPQLRDLAFSVDIGYSLCEKGPEPLSEGLWRRAVASGAFNVIQKRAFGIADDIYGAGLLFAYLAFVPFCETGIIDSISLQRLLETTFQLDLQATREYCLADDRLLEAVKFLDLGDGAGWELLQAMLNPDYRKRPVGAAVLNHRFLNGA